jgi:hypothetical protein
MMTKLRTLEINGSELSFVHFLHHGSGGLTSIYQEENGQKYILKSTLGEDATHEAVLNQRLNRLYFHEKAEGSEKLLLSYIPGEDVDRFLAVHLDIPPIDEIGCACFSEAYLNSPFNNFASGLDRNITIAIKLVQAQEALVKNDIVHSDIQLANYVIAESNHNITVEGIDFGAAIDLENVPEQKKQRFIKSNISSLIEALKAILPQETYLLMTSKLKKNTSYNDIVSALEQQLTPKSTLTKRFTPSFMSSSTDASSSEEISVPVTQKVINRRHLDFIQRRLEASIRKKNVDEADTYLHHGGKLDKKMIDQLNAKGYEAILSAMQPYVEEYEVEKITNKLKESKLK